jgi:hypothetical protein
LAIEEEVGGGEALLLAETRHSPPPIQTTVVIVHSLAVSVEQLCARSRDAPSIDNLRPKCCAICGASCRDAHGALQIVGHGMYSRQVRGLSESTWIVIWVRRFICLACGHTLSTLPDWLHPWRWYAAPAIIEALYRHCMLRQSAREIGIRFNRPADEGRWRSLDRWRSQLLVSPTLWGWLGPRLTVTRPAHSREEASSYVFRLLAEGMGQIRSGIDLLHRLPSAVRATLRNLIHNGKLAGALTQFPPGHSSTSSPARTSHVLPTEKDSGRDPP